jgi:predicted DNA-binding transcriptional regulator AlpA
MGSDSLAGLRALATALPAGSAVPVPREWLLELLDGCPAPTAEAERMLNAAEVGKLLGTEERWVYNHANQLSVKRLSRRCLRFPETAVRRYLERRR